MQEDHPITAFISMLTSIFSATFAIITLKDIQLEMAMASFIAMLSGCFAIRYYYLSSKKYKKK